MMRRTTSAKAGITPADFTFLESIVACGEQAASLQRLWEDPQALGHILDSEEILRALIESPLALPVSPSLYFYVLVRHAFLDGGIDHPELADYVAGVLVEKLSPRANRQPGAMPGWVTHAVDFMAVIQAARGMLRFQLEVAAGDQFLVLTGLFPDFVEQRAERHGAPRLGFYESFARNAYRRAADHPGLDYGNRELFGLLAEVFPSARGSLNRISERCFFLG